MNGILLIDKPGGWTSFDVVAKLRGALKQKKIGHSGTLDPMATGVLPLLVGKATRIADLLPDETKRYEAEMLLGVTTDTYDTTGEVTSSSPVNVTEADLAQVAVKFMGDIMQTPPMYSAVKVGGRRLYDLAREGKEVERKARPIHIYEMSATLAGDRVRLDILCSKGTYVRSICHDMGRVLGCGAAMSCLRRTASSGFKIQDCITVDEAVRLANGNEIEERLLPLGAAFSSLPRVCVDAHLARLLLSGVRLDAGRLGAERGITYCVYLGREFLGVGEAGADGIFYFKNLAV